MAAEHRRPPPGALPRIGDAMPTTEAVRMLRGQGRYVDDIDLPNLCHGVVLRSPHAHARIAAIDVATALESPGVLAVLTGEDYTRAGLGGMACDLPPLKRGDGSPMIQTRRPALCDGVVRTVGDPVAFVVAETRTQAMDAAELIEIDFEEMPAVLDMERAIRADSPKVWPDAPDNICFELAVGDAAATEQALEQAAHRVSARFVNNRVTAVTMEPRGYIGSYDRHDGRYTLYGGVQTPHQLRRELAQEFFGIAEQRIRVVCPDIGGSFGMKGTTFPEIVLCLWASEKLGRPVKWVAGRNESFLSDDHARDNLTEATLALDEEGRFVALRVETLANLGAYLATRGTLPPTFNLGNLAGTYTTPAIHARVRGVFTNTASTSPYRGAGRPEASYVLERLIDLAAHETGTDPVELRRRNTIPEDAMPYRTALTFTYDCGRFENGLKLACEAIDRPGFAARRAASQARGLLRGFGIANVIEQAAGPNIETAQIRFDASGCAQLLLGTVNHGQGHETSFRQILCDRLGLAPEAVTVTWGDTDRISFGRGTFGSRSITTAGTALYLAADKILAKARIVAAHLLDTEPGQLRFADGLFSPEGSNRSVTLDEVARAAYNPRRLPDGVEPGLDALGSYSPKVPNFPNSCHACEVEIDPETGAIEVTAYVVADDVGTVINPLLAEAQLHGGLAQGIGQALMEHVRHDDSGQLLSATLMDYAMPRASDLPSFGVAANPVPTKTNPLGVKGAGEAGIVGAPAAIMNAVCDALAPLGIRHMQMPATPARVWQAIQAAGSREASR